MALKIPSVLAMLGAVYFLFWSARQLFDQEIAFITCVFFCLEPNVVFAATDARPYAFALLATNFAILAFILWMTQRQMHQAVLFGAAASAILYFHYLFGAILPAFAIYYLVVRRRSIRADARQLAVALASFTLLALPLIFRVVSLYHTRDTHVVQELPAKWIALNTLVPMQTLIGFVATVFLAALVRKVKLPGRECFPAILLCPLLALVPAGILLAVSAVTPLHLVIPRYFLVVAPGSALTWGLLTSRVDSRLLRQIFCVGLVAVTVFECFSSPNARRHELSFKQAHEFVNTSVAKDKATVLTCSAFIESNFEPLPTDLHSENALVSQLSYYPLNAPVVLLPFSLNDEAMRIGSQAVRPPHSNGRGSWLSQLPSATRLSSGSPVPHVARLRRNPSETSTELWWSNTGLLQEATNAARTPPRDGLRRSSGSVDPRSGLWQVVFAFCSRTTPDSFR